MVHGIKQAARAMMKAQSECIICTSSNAVVIAGLASHGYAVHKEAILGFAISAACELGMYGVHVNCISPHGTPSDMLIDGHSYVLKEPEISLEDVKKNLAKKDRLLCGRNCSTKDVAQGVPFLASDEAGYITGHNLLIDGGNSYICDLCNSGFECIEAFTG